MMLIVENLHPSSTLYALWALFTRFGKVLWTRADSGDERSRLSVCLCADDFARGCR
jgi:hypothetical protein